MDTEAAIETVIKPRLAETFDQQVIGSLLTWATLSYATVGGDERRRYEGFVHSICSDQRVIQAWGKETAARQEEEWNALVGSETDLVDHRTLQERGGT